MREVEYTEREGEKRKVGRGMEGRVRCGIQREKRGDTYEGEREREG